MSDNAWPVDHEPHVLVPIVRIDEVDYIRLEDVERLLGRKPSVEEHVRDFMADMDRCMTCGKWREP